MSEESLVARLLENRFRVRDESVMSHWDMIRADCESREYLGGTHPRDMFESLVSSIEAEYHALLREAADALERAEKERDELRARVGSLMGGSVRLVTGSEPHMRKALSPSTKDETK